MGWRWKDENKVFEIGKNFVIAPPWLETKKKKITFVEGESFGTGVHETTVSCIEIMENFPIKDKTVLDIGSGSGILSIAALKLGAKKAVGFDIKKKAVAECIENAKLNNVKNMDCFEASCPKNIDGKFDIVFANIFFDIILSMKNDIDRLTKKGSYALLSGIVWEESYTVKSAFGNMNFEHIKTEYLKDYTTMLFKKIV
jgi:ribosomal protein L11 methyltransferase